MRIILLLKPSFKTPETSTPFEGFTPADRACLSTALSIKAKLDNVLLIAISAGAHQTNDLLLTRALEYGVDKAFRISEPSLSKNEPYNEATLIAAGIRNLQYDLVLCGNRSADWGCGIMGPMIARTLKISHIAAAHQVEIEEDYIRVLHHRSNTMYSLRLQLPALITLLDGPELPSKKREQVPPIETINLMDITLPHRFSRGVIQENVYHPLDGSVFPSISITLEELAQVLIKNKG